MKVLKKIWRYVRRHKYWVTIIVFVLLIGYFDTNSLYNRYKLHQEEEVLQAEVDAYTEQYNRDTKLYRELLKDPDAVVRIAREKYYIQNENEDVYIFGDEEND